jgi:hypothetical protein
VHIHGQLFLRSGVKGGWLEFGLTAWKSCCHAFFHQQSRLRVQLRHYANDQHGPFRLLQAVTARLKAPRRGRERVR